MNHTHNFVALSLISLCSLDEKKKLKIMRKQKQKHKKNAKNIAEMRAKEGEGGCGVLEKYLMVRFSTCHTNWLFVRAKYISWAKRRKFDFWCGHYFHRKQKQQQSTSEKDRNVCVCVEKLWFENRRKGMKGKVTTTALWKMLLAMSYLCNVLWEYKCVYMFESKWKHLCFFCWFSFRCFRPFVCSRSFHFYQFAGCLAAFPFERSLIL